MAGFHSLSHSVEGNSMSERLVQKTGKLWYSKSVHRMVRAIQSENWTVRTAMIIPSLNA